MPSTVRPASGPTFILSRDGCRAEIAAIGASLRRLRANERGLVLGYDADQVRPNFRGAILAPWPNRVSHGRWAWQGTEQQLALSEPERGHALHGLVAWTQWWPTDVRADSVTLTATLWPQPGYPFVLDLVASWTVDPHGVSLMLSATNVGTAPAPYGCGFHPYLVAPSGPLESWLLHVPARSQMLTDASLAPTEVVSVGPEANFRMPRTIGSSRLDHAFTDLTFATDDPTSAVTLVDRDGRGTRVEYDAGTRWVQIYTSDDVAGNGYRAGVAVEPMTCPPDALRTHTDVVILEPHGVHVVRWRISAVG